MDIEVYIIYKKIYNADISKPETEKVQRDPILTARVWQSKGFHPFIETQIHDDLDPLHNL